MGAERCLPALLAAACTAAEPVPVTPPEDAAYAAILELDDAGAVRASSPIASWANASALTVLAAPGTEPWIVAYSAADLDRAGIRAAIDGGAELHLEAVAGCAQRLVAPRWAARWSTSGAITEQDPAQLPPLAPRGVELACPELDVAELRLETRCGRPRCELAVVERTRCTMKLATGDCSIGQVTAVVGADGDVCMELAEPGHTCVPLGDREGARAAYRCNIPSSCDLYVRDAFTTEPPFELERIALFPAEPYYGRLSDSLPILLSSEAHSGYATDLAISGDRVFVAVSPDNMSLERCLDAASKRLFIFDVDTAELVHTATAPQCLDRLHGEVDGSGILSGFIDANTGWHIGRFDRDGRMVASAPAMIAMGRALRAVGRIADSRVVALSQGAGDGALNYHDPLTLERIGTMTADGTVDCHGMATIDRRTYVLVSEAMRALLGADLDAGTVTSRVPFSVDDTRLSSVYGVSAHAASGRFLIGAHGLWELYVGPAGGPFVNASSWEQDLMVLTAETWPRDPSLAIAGAVSIGDWRAKLLLVDPTTPRFLPGVHEVGHGPIARIAADRNGRVWVLLSWAAEVLRLTPK